MTTATGPGAPSRAALSRAFPDLPDSELAALERAAGLLARWIARLPRDVPFADEPGHIFVAPECGR